MSELLLPLPSLSPNGCSSGLTGILTRGHDNVLINCLGTSEGKEGLRWLFAFFNSIYQPLTLRANYRISPLRRSPSASVRPTSLLSASFTKYEHGLDDIIVILSISLNFQHKCILLVHVHKKISITVLCNCLKGLRDMN